MLTTLVSFLRLSEVFRRPYVPLVNLECGLAFRPALCNGRACPCGEAQNNLSKYRRGQLVCGVTEAQVAEPRMIALPDLRDPALSTQIVDPMVFLLRFRKASVLQASKPTSNGNFATIQRLFDYLTTGGILEVTRLRSVGAAPTTRGAP
jgi:hypothetical protein